VEFGRLVGKKTRSRGSIGRKNWFRGDLGQVWTEKTKIGWRFGVGTKGWVGIAKFCERQKQRLWDTVVARRFGLEIRSEGSKQLAKFLKPFLPSLVFFENLRDSQQHSRFLNDFFTFENKKNGFWDWHWGWRGLFVEF